MEKYFEFKYYTEILSLGLGFIALIGFLAVKIYEAIKRR